MDISDKHREFLRSFMKKNNLKTSSWAAKAGISEGTIRAFLTGKTSSLTTLIIEKLAKAAGVSPGEIIFEDPLAINLDERYLNRDIMERSIIKVQQIIKEKKLDFPPEKLAKIYLAWYDLKILSLEEDSLEFNDRRFNTIVKMFK